MYVCMHVPFYNTTASTWTLATAGSTWESKHNHVVFEAKWNAPETFWSVVHSFLVLVCLDNSDWSQVAKVPKLWRILRFWDAIQSTSRFLSPELRPSYSGFRVIKVRIIETHLYNKRYMHLPILQRKQTDKSSHQHPVPKKCFQS